MWRRWSRFTPKSQFKKHDSYYTCNLALHKPLWRTQSSFLFLCGWWDKASASRERHWPPYRCTALFGTSTVSEHSILKELVFPSQTAMYWICGTTTRSCTTLSGTIGKLNNSISQTSFCLFSCPFLHLCSSITPTLHHLFLTHTSSFFSESCSIPKHCKGASTSLQWFGKCFPFVSLYRFFAQALLDTCLSLSWWSFMCSSSLTRAAVTLSATLLAYSSKSRSCLSTYFCFSSTIFFGSSTQTVWSSGFSFTASVAQSFRQFFATSRVKRVNTKRTKTQREKLKDMMTSLHKQLSVSLNHKKHTIASKPCLNRKTDAFSLVDSGPSTQTFSYAQITPTRDLLFRSWWPFPPLLSLNSLGDVSCPLPSDLLGKT